MNTKKTIYFLYFFLYVTEAFEFDSFTSLFDTRIDVEGAIERFLDAVDEYYEVMLDVTVNEYIKKMKNHYL